MAAPGASREVRAAVEARRELGRDYDDELAESLLERIDTAIDARIAASVAHDDARGAGTRDWLWLALGSLALGIPLTGTASTIRLGAVIIVWAGILGVNLAHAWGQRRRSGR